MRKFIINNTQILVGKSAINNTELVNMYLGTGYTWFHLHDLPSSHLVIEKKIAELSDDEKKVCGNIVKYYSKYKKDWTKKYFVDMVCIDNVTPQNKPGLVTITKGKKLKLKPIFGFNPDNYIQQDEKKNES